MLMFWIGDDGALRTKDVRSSDAADELDCELSGRRAFGTVRVMPACQRGAPEFTGGIGGDVDPAERRKEEPAPNRRRAPDRHHPPHHNFDQALAEEPVVLPIYVLGLNRPKHWPAR